MICSVLFSCIKLKRWSSEGVKRCQNNSVIRTMFLNDTAEVPYYHFDCSESLCTSVFRRDRHPHFTVLLMNRESAATPSKHMTSRKTTYFYFPQIVMLMMPHTFKKCVQHVPVFYCVVLRAF